jgi:hypothetical protein
MPNRQGCLLCLAFTCFFWGGVLLLVWWLL